MQAVRDMTNPILNALYAYEESVLVRFRAADAEVAALGARPDAVERRALVVEKRLLMHPPAA